ncbi:MAG: glucose-6-phosphate dehydrogenase [Vicinamibacterales bacterium]
MDQNPLRDGLRIQPSPGPTTIVIFGASGDLTRRKLLPALYRLSIEQRLPPRLSIIGIARTPMDDEGLRKQFRESVDASETGEVAGSFEERLRYLSGELDDPAVYARLRDHVGSDAADSGILFYLAIPPAAYSTVVAGLGAAGLTRAAGPGAWRRIIVEKPFGSDLASARALNILLHEHFDESQIYRIDHYLGKETVQNLLVFRFGNGMFEPIWNRRYIDHVQITAAETVGVESRAAYYETAGALRDMVQNHLMQLLTLVAMEPPIAFTADSVRDRKMDALLSVQPLVDEKRGTTGVVRAQYGDGWVDGHEVPGYKREPGVRVSSVTETFVGLRLQLDSWRWAGVPFYLRTGKRLPKRTTEIAIQFKRPPLEIFKRVTSASVAPNLLIVNVQPDEGISLRFEAKLPGTRMQLSPVMMNFRYGATFGEEVPEAYETLLLDAMIGDSTLFARHDFAEASWALITPVHEAWAAAGSAGIPHYEAGEWGPAQADQLMQNDGRRWRTL